MSRRKTNLARREQPDPRGINLNDQTFYQKHTDSNTINFTHGNPQRQRRPVHIVPKTANQEDYVMALRDSEVDVVIAGGPAGTGKTFLATLAAIEAYRNKTVSRIVLCRPAVSIEGEDHGFLPGDLASKLAPWSRPILDVFREYYHPKEIEKMVSDEVIEFVSLGMIRGRSMRDTFFLLDESQNSSPLQLKSLLTRIGEGSKFVLTGDVEQADRHDSNNGLLDLQRRLTQRPIRGVELCEFDVGDIQRHRLISEFIDLYN